MTQQVRNGYRNHRKATWGLALALIVAIAAVAIPIASGASDKTYTLAVSPASICSSSTPGEASTVVTITNTAKSATLGSMEISFPLNSISTVSRGTVRQEATRDVIQGLNNLNLAKNAPLNITVTFKANVTFGPTNITAVVKQANNFNDSSGTANLFENPTPWPQLTVGGCVTVSGTVYLDNDGDGTYDSTGSPADAVQSGWSVSLYNTSTSGRVGNPTLSGADGIYTIKDVPIGQNYKVCVQPPANSGAWSQTTPPGTACSAESSATPAGKVITNLQAATATGNDFGVEQTVTPSCNGTFSAPLIGMGTGIVDYRAQLTAPPGTNGCKASVVMYSYLDSSGKPYATIHPPATSTDTTDYWVVERLRWKVDKSGAQNPVTLQYDDSKPYGDNMSTMKMCTADPRLAGQDFQLAVNPATVMPSGTNADGVAHTTCMIQSTDLPSGATYNYEAYTVSIVDGLKGPT
jgi:hypothetical protein